MEIPENPIKSRDKKVTTMKFTGRVTKAVDKSGLNKEGKPFTAWQYCLEEEGVQYPQSCLLETFGDRTSKPNIGDVIEAEFNMKCTEYEGKLYGRNNAWKITILSSAGVFAQQEVPGSYQQVQSSAPITDQAPSDDLPF